MEPLSVSKKGSRLVLCLQLPPMYSIGLLEHETLKKLETFEIEQDLRTIVLDLSRVKRIGTDVIRSLIKFLQNCVRRPTRKPTDKIFVVSNSVGLKHFLHSSGVLGDICVVDSLSLTQDKTS